MTTATPTTATSTTTTSTTTAATKATRGRPFGRPMLYTAYGQEMALFNTLTKKVMVGLLLVLAAVAPLGLVDKDLKLLATACVTAIGAIGLGLVTGYAGQVSLGHAFFLAMGAYTAAVISGNPEGRTLGFGVQEILIWLPAAGIVAGLAGVIVAPLATRLRGLYLAVVTLGLVFIGEYVLREWSEVTGGSGIGRPAPTPALFGQRLDVATPIFDGYVLTRDQKLYWLMLILLVIFALAARNIARSRVGRAFTSIRDRDIAAGVMGVNLARYKTIAFAVSSFYAGCAGALLYVSVGFFVPDSFNLEMSVLFIAMVLIGGAGTISGAILGAFFFTYLPTLTRQIPSDVISGAATDTPNIFQLQLVLYGALIIGFLLFEPRGLFGLWIRVRNFWKAWPFKY
jgi:branched-chain amino acid transport system permease protein